MGNTKWHIICEKDVGLFSLIQQVIGHIPLALSEQRVPIVLFGSRCCYWTKVGYQGKSTVWEYYFEPIVRDHAVDTLPKNIVSYLLINPPNHESAGDHFDSNTYVSNHFGDHSDFKGKTIQIPYHWDDPGIETRKQASEIIRQYVRPRPYIVSKTRAFLESNMAGKYTIGVHMRATDVNDLKTEHNIHRRYSYRPEAYKAAITEVLRTQPNACVFIATDSQDALQLMMKAFGNKVIHYSSIYHIDGAVSGSGPTGWGVPGYLTEDTQKAAQNGTEAVIDYLLLSECQYLIHNGSGLARTVLLKNPDLPHHNIHSRKEYLKRLLIPGNLEFFYFLKIVAQKGLWKTKRFLRQRFSSRL